MYATMSKSKATPRAQRTPSTRVRREQHSPGERIFLAVPHYEVRAAMQLGAQWDQAAGVCWIPRTEDRSPFARWIVDGAALIAAGMNTADIIADFKEALQSYGLKPVTPIPDGKWHCAPLSSDKGDKIHETHGGYILSLTGNPRGYIRNFKGQSGPWRYRGAKLTREQYAAIEAENRDREIMQQQALEAQQKEVAGRILEVLVPLTPAVDHPHGYLSKKGVRAHGLRLANGRTDDLATLLNMPKFKPSKTCWLIVPGRDVRDNLLTVQAIDENGSKLFASGAKKKGALHVIGVRRVRDLVLAPAVLFCEGYATGASLHEATGLPVVVTFDSGNLVEVARQLVDLLPAEQPKIVCADNDQYFVERALAKIAAIGANNAAAREKVQVRAGAGDASREIELAGVVADGQWHEGTNGKYRLVLQSRRGVVCELTLDIVPKVGHHIRQSTRNAGAESGDEAARILRGQAIAPAFSSLEAEPTDFNDLASREGDVRVAQLVQAVLPFSLPIPLHHK